MPICVANFFAKSASPSATVMIDAGIASKTFLARSSFFVISVDIDVINTTAFSSLCTLPEATLAQLIELDEAEVTGLFSIESMRSPSSAISALRALMLSSLSAIHLRYAPSRDLMTATNLQSVPTNLNSFLDSSEWEPVPMEVGKSSKDTKRTTLFDSKKADSFNFAFDFLLLHQYVEEKSKQNKHTMSHYLQVDKMNDVSKMTRLII
ncbi:hypothetical protein BpHYR1_007770 [Brachionus plicatilis]|uniref:Uncharacterized protein n=1 Tax=Brachionus plicatilis TaxID=10195 RepID=A0A3M7SYG8_BRAPC|nr:hypothetical protein BpHYR1_007770 [Brachionus plicatilis]